MNASLSTTFCAYPTEYACIYLVNVTSYRSLQRSIELVPEGLREEDADVPLLVLVCDVEHEVVGADGANFGAVEHLRLRRTLRNAARHKRAIVDNRDEVILAEARGERDRPEPPPLLKTHVVLEHVVFVNRDAGFVPNCDDVCVFPRERRDPEGLELSVREHLWDLEGAALLAQEAPNHDVRVVVACDEVSVVDEVHLVRGDGVNLGVCDHALDVAAVGHGHAVALRRRADGCAVDGDVRDFTERLELDNRFVLCFGVVAEDALRVCDVEDVFVVNCHGDHWFALSVRIDNLVRFAVKDTNSAAGASKGAKRRNARKSTNNADFFLDLHEFINVHCTLRLSARPSSIVHHSDQRT